MKIILNLEVVQKLDKLNTKLIIFTKLPYLTQNFFLVANPCLKVLNGLTLKNQIELILV